MNMSMGQLGHPSTVFARKFRWTLEGENLPPSFVKNVSIDYNRCRVKFEYYDVATENGSFHALQWANSLRPTETLTFTTYDGCGNWLYRSVFSSLYITEHSSDFDYNSSEISCQQITVGYAGIKNEYASYQPLEPIKPEPSTVKFCDKTTWSAVFKSAGTELCRTDCLTLNSRPQVDIEEVEINFLNSKAFLPGKAKWQPLKIDIDDNLINQLANWTFTAFLTLWGDGKELETWELQNAWIEKDSTTTMLNFDSAVYKRV